MTGAGTVGAVRRAIAGAVLVAAFAVMVGPAAHGVQVVTALDRRPAAEAGPWWVVVVGVLVLGGSGALPARRLVGRRLLAVFLAPCVGAVLAAVSVVVTVMVGSEPLRWFVAFAAAVNAAALASVAAQRDSRPVAGAGWQRRAVAVLSAAVVVAAVAFVASVIGRRQPSGVAETSWLRLAHLAVHGHRAVLRAVGGPAMTAHLLGSPLAAGCAAVTWLVTRQQSAAAAASVLVVVTAAAVGAAATALLEVGAHLGRRPSVGRHGGVVVDVVACAVAAVWALAVPGAAPGVATSGGTTVVSVSAASGALVLLTVLPPTGWRLRAAIVLGAMAALATPAGTVAVALVAVAGFARRTVGSGLRVGGALDAVAGSGPTVASGMPLSWRRRFVARTVDGVGLVAALGALAVWPLAGAAVTHGHPSVGLPPAGAVHRLLAAWDAVADPLRPALWALGVMVVAAVALGRWRRRMGAGSDAGMVVVGAGVLVVSLAASSWDVGVVQPLLQAPPARAAAWPLLAALLAMGVWVQAATVAALGDLGDRTSGPVAPPGHAAGVAEGPPVVPLGDRTPTDEPAPPG